ncbi:MAG: D-Ala-D-Ala carboxypeptidase family metallohydrolase [Halieaceae bacterium]|nr:D-Ala-D-Ala carboxypeptidase family metallohydrolase [Halieaceae bacterium]
MRQWLLCLALLSPGLSAAPLALEVRGHPVQMAVFSLFMQPGEQLRLGVGNGVSAEAGGVTVTPVQGGLELVAPQVHGLYPVRLLRGAEEALLNVWVSISGERLEGEYLNGYRIGSYPPPRSQRPNYEPPAGFFEVTADNVDTRLTPHFTLRQFVCKQASDYPKYVVIQEGLLVMLEGLLAEVRSQGFDIETFGVISGYRTPYYNHRIGNVPYSRHVYGDAFDFFIDEDGDGRMDDIDSDGMRNEKDIQRFFAIVDSFMRRPENKRFLGGIGKYNKTRRHGGFIHVDTRGYQARW